MNSDALTRNELLLAAAAKATAYSGTADIAQIKSATDVNSESSRVATVFDQMQMLFLNAPFLDQEHIVFAPPAPREAARVVDGVASCIATNEQITQVCTVSCSE